MGKANELSIQEQEKWFDALNIAIQAGVIKRCSIHEDSTFLGNNDIEQAYKLGSSRFKKGELNLFKHQHEVTDTIKSVVEEHTLEECPYGEGCCPKE